MRTLLPLVLLLAAIWGCGSRDSGTGTWGVGGTPAVTTPADESGSSTAESSSSTTQAMDTSTSTASTTTTAASSSGGSTWDMGDMPDFDPTKPAGCDGKIDFLFVISSEGTMKDFQERLIAAFPGFMTTIEQQFSDFDYHILVADPDGGWKISDCSVCTEDCDPQGSPPYCGAVLEPCDKGEIGAGVTFPSGTAASNRRCELDSGRRYITSGQQNLPDAFACIAQVGTGGTGTTGQAMAAAVQPAINDPNDADACNRGFLREDAFLVVTIIQDTYDQDSLGTVDEWITALRDAKKGDDDAFAVLVLTTDVDVGYGQLCWPNLYDMNKNRLRLLVEGVKHGFIDSICMDDFVPFFDEHTNVLVELCDDFVPPG